jgi:hypothetical protein
MLLYDDSTCLDRRSWGPESLRIMPAVQEAESMPL